MHPATAAARRSRTFAGDNALLRPLTPRPPPTGEGARHPLPLGRRSPGVWGKRVGVRGRAARLRQAPRTGPWRVTQQRTHHELCTPGATYCGADEGERDRRPSIPALLAQQPRVQPNSERAHGREDCRSLTFVLFLFRTRNLRHHERGRRRTGSLRWKGRGNASHFGRPARQRRSHSLRKTESEEMCVRSPMRAVSAVSGEIRAQDQLSAVPGGGAR